MYLDNPIEYLKNKNFASTFAAVPKYKKITRVNIPTESESCDIDTPVTFNANLFKEVLVANRECSSAILEVSTEGLARVNFKIDDYDSTYYIVAMQDLD